MTVRRLPRILKPEEFQKWFDSSPIRTQLREREHLLWLSRNCWRVKLILPDEPEDESYNWVVFEADDGSASIKWHELLGWEAPEMEVALKRLALG